MVTRRILLIFTAIVAVALWGAGLGVIGPFLPDIAKSFGISIAVAGTLQSAGQFGSLFLAPIAGYLADRYGKQRIFLATGVLVTIGYVLMRVAPSFGGLIGAWILAGSLGAALGSLAIAMITDLNPRNVVRNTNLLLANLCLGAAASPVIISRMVGVDGAWRGVFFALAFCAGAIVLLGLCIKAPAAPPAAPISLRVAASLLRDRPIQLLALAIMLYVGVEISIATWVFTILREAYHYPAMQATIATGLFWFAMGLGRIVTGVITQRVHGVVVLRWLIPCGIIAFTVLLLPVGPWHFWVGIAMTGAAFSGIWPILVGLGCTHHPSYSGSVVTLLASCGTMGGGILPLIIGLVIKQLPMWWGIAVMAGFFVILALALLAYGRIAHPPTAVEQPTTAV